MLALLEPAKRYRRFPLPRSNPQPLHLSKKLHPNLMLGTRTLGSRGSPYGPPVGIALKLEPVDDLRAAFINFRARTLLLFYAKTRSDALASDGRMVKLDVSKGVRMNETDPEYSYLSNFFASTVKKPTESLKTISEILNAVPVTGYHNRPELVMNDGLRLSVQGRDNSVNLGCSCSPKSSVGPWTALEVGYPDRWVARLLPHIEGGEDNPVNSPEESVYHYVPAEVLTKIIEEAEGVAGYWYEGKLHKLGTICDGLMWMLGTYGYPKPKHTPKGCYHQTKEGLWATDTGHLFKTAQEAADSWVNG